MMTVTIYHIPLQVTSNQGLMLCEPSRQAQLTLDNSKGMGHYETPSENALELLYFLEF